VPNTFKTFASISLLALLTFSNLAGCAVNEPTDDETSISESNKPGADVLLDSVDELQVEGAGGDGNVPSHPELDGDEDLGVEVSELLAGFRVGAGAHRAPDASVADGVVVR
jgi:hypothetical protein